MAKEKKKAVHLKYVNWYYLFWGTGRKNNKEKLTEIQMPVGHQHKSNGNFQKTREREKEEKNILKIKNEYF